MPSRCARAAAEARDFILQPTMVSPSKATSLATGTVGGGGTKVDAGAIAAPFRVEVREKVEALKAKGIGE